MFLLNIKIEYVKIKNYKMRYNNFDIDSSRILYISINKISLFNTNNSKMKTIYNI